MELHSTGNNDSCTLIEEKFLHVLNKQATVKTKLLRYNNNSFMSKQLKKNAMLRSKLKNIFNRNRSYENWCKYKR